MKPDVLIGSAHPLAPYFIFHRLRSGARVGCVADDDRDTDTLCRELHAVFRRHGAGVDDIATMCRRLAFIDTPIGAGGLFLFLGAADIAPLCAGVLPERLQRALALAGAPQAAAAFHVIVDLHCFPSDQPFERSLDRIEQKLRAGFVSGGEMHTYYLGPYARTASREPAADDLGVYAPEALVDQAIGAIVDVRRRAPSYFSRYPVRLPLADDTAVHVMSAEQAAEFIAGARSDVTATRHWVCGRQTVKISEWLERIAAATGTDVRPAETTSDPPDAVSALITENIQRIARLCNAPREIAGAGRSAAFTVHELTAPDVDRSACIQHVLDVREKESRLMRQRFTALSGMQRHQLDGSGMYYYRYGNGADVLLLINAFGLSLDFWQMLAATLGTDCKLIALDKTDAAGISQTSYSTENYAADYVAAAAAALRSENAARCHVASWCSGAKLAIELAHALRSSVRSLSLIAPSFAGMEGFSGCDSAYEKNLHTMCKIVSQTPRAAGGMASAMTAMLQKNSADLDRFRRGGANAVDVFELPDDAHLPLLYQPFADAGNMIEFSKQLLHFRAHDVTPRLSSEALTLPILLVTGDSDTTTSAPRAQDICDRLSNVVSFTLRGGSHYLIHQNYRVVADLLTRFMQQGLSMHYTHPRVERRLQRPMVQMVAGEL